MEEIAEENVNLSWEIRVTEGRAGTDPEAPNRQGAGVFGRKCAA